MELMSATESMLQKINDHGKTIHKLEQTSSNHSDQLSSLDSAVNMLKAQMKLLADKSEDLEGRSRRNNLWLVGIPEGTEGPRPTEFIGQLLKDLLSLDEEPLIDRAHHTIRAKLKEGEAPRPFIIRVYFFHIRNEILCRASKTTCDSPLLFQGKSRGESQVVLLLGLMFPAVLKIALLSGASHTFENPAIASTFIASNLAMKISYPDTPFLGGRASSYMSTVQHYLI